MFDWDDAPDFGSRGPAPGSQLGNGPSVSSCEHDSLAVLARSPDAPRGPLEELLPELADGCEWLTHIVVLDAGEGLVCLAAPEIPRCLVVPGSFNPMHEGHLEMAVQGARVMGRHFKTTLFELCTVNATKGALTTEDVLTRVKSIVAKGHRALVTRAMLFQQKATLCPGCDFVVGFDTYRRIVTPKFYVPPGVQSHTASEEEERQWVVGALRRLKTEGIRLAVAGRLDEGVFRTLESDSCFLLPDDLASLFLPIPDFRLDISSTEIRNRPLAR